MSTDTAAAAGGAAVSDYWRSRRDRLFIASCVALIVTAMSFAIRGDLIQPLGQQFGLTKEQIGWVVGTAFWGFTLAMIIGGPLCDVIGMGRLLVLAFIGHAIGIVMTILAHDFWTLFFSTLAFGLGNGFVEAACNPLIATLYPDQKIKRLNHFHAWFPGGIVIGGLVAYGITQSGLGGENAWKIKMASMLIPLVIYALMFVGQKFPKTERAAAGVSMGEMFAACAKPFFVLFVICMLMTAVTELGPQQWFPNILTLTTGVTGILFLIWITGLMAVGRNFAGPIVHRMSPVALLICSSAFSLVGLYMLSGANSAAPAFISATLFAIGVCFFWPTMLGVVNERFPRTGALGLAIMGGAGMLASSFAQPWIGAKFDSVTQQQVQSNTDKWQPALQQWAALNIQSKDADKDPTKKHDWTKELSDAQSDPVKMVKLLGDATAVSAADAKDDPKQAETLKPASDFWAVAQKDGGAAAIRQVVVLPIILLIVFTLIYFADKARGGYKKELLSAEQVTGGVEGPVEG